MTRKLEKDHEDRFVEYALRRGCRAWKLIFIGRKGFPDRIVFMPGGRVIFMEFKRKGNKQSPHQDKIQKILEGLGFNWYTPYTFEEAKEILDVYLETP